MIGNVYKTLILLFLITEQSITFLFIPHQPIDKKVNPSVFDPEAQTRWADGQKSIQNPQPENKKVPAYNLHSEKTIANVSQKATENSSSLLVCGDPADCAMEVQSMPTLVPTHPVYPTIIPEPTVYPYITLIPEPTYYPVPTIIPEPTSRPYPKITPLPCGCGPDFEKRKEIICPMTLEMPCML